jgi:hypothetical protein
MPSALADVDEVTARVAYQDAVKRASDTNA